MNEAIIVHLPEIPRGLQRKVNRAVLANVIGTWTRLCILLGGGFLFFLCLRFLVPFWVPPSVVVGILFGALAAMYAEHHLIAWLYRRGMQKRIAARGECVLTLDARGVETKCNFGTQLVFWSGVEQPIRVGDATSFMCGMTVFTLPDSALPEGVSPELLVDRIAAWRSGA